MKTNKRFWKPRLGGDFIVDKNGILRLVHPSHDPSDRPSVEELLGALKQIQP